MLPAPSSSIRSVPAPAKETLINPPSAVSRAAATAASPAEKSTPITVSFGLEVTLLSNGSTEASSTRTIEILWVVGPVLSVYSRLITLPLCIFEISRSKPVAAPAVAAVPLTVLLVSESARPCAKSSSCCWACGKISSRSSISAPSRPVSKIPFSIRSSS